MTFDAFWTQRAQLAAEERPVEIRRLDIPSPTAVYEELTFPNLDEVTVRARYIHPVSGTPAPTVLMYHDDGRGVRGWHHMTRFLALGFGVVALENRYAFLDITAGWRRAPAGMAAAELYSDAVVTGYVARRLPGVDGEQLITWGEGLGGGMAIAAAVLVPGVQKCAALNPLPADPAGAFAQGCSAGPLAQITDHFRQCDPTHAEEDAFFQALSYLDCANFAALLRCPLLLGTSGMDRASPAAAQRAVFDRASCVKKQLFYPKYEHERINFFENELLKFLHP